MGWDYHQETPPYDRRSIIRRHLSKEFEVVKDTVVGTTYYGAIREKNTGHVHALVVLTDVDKKDWCNFGMKWMTENCGPYAYDCPKSILDLLSPTDNEYAKEWRQKCLEHQQQNKAKKDFLRTAPFGTRIKATLKNGEERLVTKMPPNHQFKTWWLLVAENNTYLPKQRIESAVPA